MHPSKADFSPTHGAPPPPVQRSIQRLTGQNRALFFSNRRSAPQSPSSVVVATEDDGVVGCLAPPDEPDPFTVESEEEEKPLPTLTTLEVDESQFTFGEGDTERQNRLLLTLRRNATVLSTSSTSDDDEPQRGPIPRPSKPEIRLIALSSSSSDESDSDEDGGILVLMVTGTGGREVVVTVTERGRSARSTRTQSNREIAFIVKNPKAATVEVAMYDKSACHGRGSVSLRGIERGMVNTEEVTLKRVNGEAAGVCQLRMELIEDDAELDVSDSDDDDVKESVTATGTLTLDTRDKGPRLTVMVVEARGVPGERDGGEIYCAVRVGREERRTKRKRVVAEPAWNEILNFSLKDKANALKMEIRTIRGHTKFVTGSVIVPLNRLSEGTTNMWIPIVTSAVRPWVGAIHLVMTLAAATPMQEKSTSDLVVDSNVQIKTRERAKPKVYFKNGREKHRYHRHKKHTHARNK